MGVLTSCRYPLAPPCTPLHPLTPPYAPIPAALLSSRRGRARPRLTSAPPCAEALAEAGAPPATLSLPTPPAGWRLLSAWGPTRAWGRMLGGVGGRSEVVGPETVGRDAGGERWRPQRYLPNLRCVR